MVKDPNVSVNVPKAARAIHLTSSYRLLCPFQSLGTKALNCQIHP